MHADPLLQILILLTASVGVVALVRRLALPAILGYLLVGAALGPRALGLVDDTATTRLLAEFGITFLLFTLGLEFSRPRLVAMRAEVLGVGGLQVLLTASIVAGVAVAGFGIAPATAIVTGGAIAMSSTAIIVAQLTEQSEINRSHGRLAVSICLFQDLALALVLAAAWATRAAGLSLALGGFLAGMMLDGRLLIRDFTVVGALLAGMLVLKIGSSRRRSRSHCSPRRSGDVVILHGTPEAIDGTERLLLVG